MYLLEQIWWRMGEEAYKPRSPVFICEHGLFLLRILWSANGKLVLRGPVVWDSRGATMPFISGSFWNPNYQTPNHQPSTIIWYCWWFRNPAPPGMYTTLWIMWYLLPYQLVQEFFHQQYGAWLTGTSWTTSLIKEAVVLATWRLGSASTSAFFFWGDELYNILMEGFSP